MPEEKDDTTTEETGVKPTITIAEKDGSSDLKPTITIAEKEGAAAAGADAKPTITIAEKEKDGGE